MPKSQEKTQIEPSSPLLYIFLFFTGWGFLALLAAWAGIFYWFWFVGYTTIFISALLWKNGFPRRSAPRNNETFLKKLREFCQMSNVRCQVLFFLLLSFFLASFFQPASFFSGRDEGSLFQAAGELVKDHSLKSASPESAAFFQIYGEGKALNFPGFFYTESGALVSQFPTGYIAWSGSFASLLAIYGFPFANAILLFLFFLAFTGLLKQFVSPLWVWMGVAIAATSFPLFWFPRFTLSENFALAFLWIFLFALTHFIKRPTNTLLVLTFMSGTLLLFGRIEGFIFAFLGTAVILIAARARKFLLRRPLFRLLIPALILLALLLTSCAVLNAFYTSIGKALLGSDLTQSILNGSDTQYAQDQLSRLSLFGLYGIAIEIIVGLAGLFVFARKGKKYIFHILPFIITFPVFFYLFWPFISHDHPWMLRRYMFAIVPVLLYFSVLLLARVEAIRSRSFALILAVTMLLAHLGALVSFIPLRQGSDLIRGTYDIARFISKNDLLLIDREASGDGWHMLPGPLRTLFNRRAVYFFHPDDLEKLNTGNFEHVFFLVPQERIFLYKDMLADTEPIHTFQFTATLLESPMPLSEKRFPKLQTKERTLYMYPLSK